jgi:asparagine synthase (glutamine-hydrolysing)
MCGIVGILNLDPSSDGPSEGTLRQMLAMIRHRGPDQFGVFLDDTVGLGNARLSIIDLSGGQQPISNEDGSLWIVFNGEIFNYVELRPELESRGHRFATHSDTEVLLHLFEEYGPECLERLNGQFAFAIWNTREKSLFLARDRLGVRPLYYTHQGSRLVVASEIKSILATGLVTAEIDPVVLDQIFTYWSPLSPHTVFKNVFELPPGHYLQAANGCLTIKSYWEPEFPERSQAAASGSEKSIAAYAEELSALLIDAVKVRLRADVSVGAYLSGGLDSSVIASVIRNYTSNHLDTFSVAFDDVNFDESAWQMQMAKFLGTEHQVVRATHEDIGGVFPEVIWHTEVPVMRTSPAPMFLLSKLVRDSGYKVVLTGEGADEFLGGYDIFKEAKVRRFWAAQPESKWRLLLFQRLYPDIVGLTRNNGAMLAAFFREDLGNVDALDYSHAVRWRNGRRNCRFFSETVREEIASSQSRNGIERQIPPAFGTWEPLARAQYLEIKIFLSQYLLSSQGDRMGMAHSIEGRFPFLDCRVVEFCNQLPARLKLRALTEKFLLKQLGRKWLPPEIWQRPKRPYRAPIHRSFFNAAAPEYVRELLSPQAIARVGMFKPEMVNQLVQKILAGRPVGESDDMALVGILSTQLLHSQFVSNFRPASPLSAIDDVKVCRQ